MSHTPRKMEPGLPPVKVSVSFRPPEPCVIELQGPALRQYYRWLEDPDEGNEDELEQRIYEQMEHHILLWTQLDNWDVEP